MNDDQLFAPRGPGITRTQFGKYHIFSAPRRQPRASKTITPWQPLRTGPLKFRMRDGFVFAFNRAIRASNAGVEFTVPPNSTSGFFVWLQATITGDVGFETIGSLFYGSGTGVPGGPLGDPETGAAPATTYFPIVLATSNAHRIDDAFPLLPSNLTLSIELQNITCSQKTRALLWGPLANRDVF